jgi:hypothetical protein
VLQGSLVGRLDPDFRMLAVQAAGPLPGFGIDRNRIIAINAFDLQLWKT